MNLPDNVIQTIAKKQGWSETTIIQLLTSFLHTCSIHWPKETPMIEDLQSFLQNVANEENSWVLETVDPVDCDDLPKHWLPSPKDDEVGDDEFVCHLCYRKGDIEDSFRSPWQKAGEMVYELYCKPCFENLNKSTQ